ncbi:MAG: hypothetical protein ABH867_01490 [Patescibacteria group bacterium]|nr:hypothetical protein [Patescibacteria group bacterium]
MATEGKRFKRTLLIALHLNYIAGILYALFRFLSTPRVQMMFFRRLWAYEVWIILSFYLIFLYLVNLETEKISGKAIGRYVKKMRKILSVNLVLLIFPWGLFLMLMPSFLANILGLNSIYWRILGGMSLVGALIYSLPYFQYRKKLAYYVYLFGMIDNFLAAIIALAVFLRKKSPLIAMGSIPLLFYFSYFFLTQARRYRQLFKKSFV